MDTYETRVVLFALVLIVLLMPVFGPGQLWTLAVIALLAAFDIYRHRRKRL